MAEFKYGESNNNSLRERAGNYLSDLVDRISKGMAFNKSGNASSSIQEGIAKAAKAKKMKVKDEEEENQ